METFGPVFQQEDMLMIKKANHLTRSVERQLDYLHDTLLI
jgi:hypothetical protein